jgi:lysophospholipase L1-like esterase
MMRVKNRLLVNISLSLVSITCTLAVGYYAYHYLRKSPTNLLFSDRNDEYMFSLYNRKGEKISDIEGALKLVIDPFTIYQNFPNQKSRKYSINSYGFRDTYTSDKPSTAIVIGGSAAFGFALNGNNQTFSSHISKNNQKYNVINAAVIGFLSGQELSQMVHYLDDLKPSLYIIFDGWNDIQDPFSFARNDFKEKRPIHRGPIGYNNAFFGIESRLADYFQITKKEEKPPLVKLDPIGDPLYEGDLYQKIFKTYVANIGKMHAFAESREAKLLVVFQPELGNKKTKSLYEEEVLKTWIEKYGYLDNKISARYKRLVIEAKDEFLKKGISFIDINDTNEFSENPQTLFFDVIHPNELGHEVIASIINQTLLENF